MKNIHGQFISYPFLMLLIARTAQVVILIVLIGLLLVAPAQAATVTLTLNETDFGLGLFSTTDNGATWIGTVDVDTYDNTPGADFPINSYQIMMAYRDGSALNFNSTTTSTTVGNPHVRNDSLGSPEFMPGISNIFSFDYFFTWNIPVRPGVPGASYILSFNAIDNLGFDGTNKGTWTLESRVWDGVEFGRSETFRYGSYELSVSSVPIPAAAWLFGSGLLGLVGIARRKAT